MQDFSRSIVAIKNPGIKSKLKNVKPEIRCTIELKILINNTLEIIFAGPKWPSCLVRLIILLFKINTSLLARKKSIVNFVFTSRPKQTQTLDYYLIILIFNQKRIQSGQKRFEIFSTKLCCPNFHLNLDLNECVPSNQITFII